MRIKQTAKHKHPSSPYAFIWILFSIFFATSAAMFSKKAALVGMGIGLTRSLRSPWYLGTLICLGLLACVWMTALRYYPLSYVYPFLGTHRGTVLFGAWLLFHEQVHFQEVLGIIIIISGIALVGGTAKQ